MEIQITLVKWDSLIEELKRRADFIKRKEMELQGLRKSLRKSINEKEKEKIHVANLKGWRGIPVRLNKRKEEA